MKKVTLFLAILAMLSACSVSKKEEASFVLPERVSLRESDKNYLTDKQIESIQTYGDVFNIFGKLSDALLEELGEKVDQLPSSQQLLASAYSSGMTIAMESLKEGIDLAMEQSDYNLEDKIPKEDLEEAIVQMKGFRDSCKEELENFDDYIKEMSEGTASPVQSSSDEADDADDEADEDEEETVETSSFDKKRALWRAEADLELKAFSKEGLYNQLLFEKFSEEAAQYAVDNIDADWKEQAIERIKEYLDFMEDLSRDRLAEQLKFEKFTEEEIEYAVTNYSE